MNLQEQKSINPNFELASLLNLYERTLEQDPNNETLEYLRKEIINIDPSQEFLIDPFVRISLPTHYTNITKRHIQALQRLDETLPPQEVAVSPLKTFEQDQTAAPYLSPSQKLKNLLSSKTSN